MSLDESLYYIDSKIPFEREVAFYNLKNVHILNKKSWMKFLELLKTKSIDMSSLIYTFSRIFSNPDSVPVNLEKQDKLYVTNSLNQILDEKQVIALLDCIDEDCGIGRGTVGQCVETILNSLNKSEILLNIINNFNYGEYKRNCAACIYAFRNASEYEKLYQKNLIIRTEFNEMLFNQIKNYGEIDLY